MKLIRTPVLAMGLVCLYTLLLAFIRGLIHANVNDLGLADEASYLWKGLHYFEFGGPNPEFSPLYTLWYWLQHFLITDPIALYQTNWGVLMFATLILLYSALRHAGVSVTASWLTLAYSSVTVYFDVWPYVSLAASALALLAAVVILRAPSATIAYSSSAAVLAIGVFIRPEFLLPFVFVTVTAGYFGFRERGTFQRSVRPLLLPLLFFVVLCVIFGLPFGGGRSIVAFGQHYAANIVQFQHLDIDPWHNWRRFISADFGGGRY